jgi:hypothetical protein
MLRKVILTPKITTSLKHPTIENVNLKDYSPAMFHHQHPSVYVPNDDAE